MLQFLHRFNRDEEQSISLTANAIIMYPLNKNFPEPIGARVLFSVDL